MVEVTYWLGQSRRGTVYDLHSDMANDSNGEQGSWVLKSKGECTKIPGPTTTVSPISSLYLGDAENSCSV